MKTCLICKKEFDGSGETCSPSCRAKLGHQRQSKTYLVERVKDFKICPVCNQKFYRKETQGNKEWDKQVTCSKKCKGIKAAKVQADTLGRGIKATKICEVCGKEFEVNISSAIGKKQTCCSKECSTKAIHTRLHNKRIVECDIRESDTKECKGCGELFHRRRHEKDERWLKRKYCCLKCRRQDQEAKDHIAKSSRIATLKRIEENFGRPFPCYSRVACSVFKELDEKYKLEEYSQYATHNGGEYRINELGYFLDYINHKTKMIIEWDDTSHFREGKRTHHDMRRWREVREYFPDYLYISVEEGKRSNHEVIDKLCRIIERRA